MSCTTRVLVTGANGFVGRWLVRRLSESLADPACLTALGHGGAGDDSATTGVDITDADMVAALVAKVRPTAVVHLAAISHLGQARASAHEAWDVNLYGTLNLAEAVMRSAPEALFMYVGSSEVYGASFNTRDGVLDETAVLSPRNVYAATKAAADLMIGQMAEDGLRAVRFRPFNHTGPGQSPRFVVPSFAAQIAAIERGERANVLKVGNLDARRDFLDVRDVVEAYVLALSASEAPPTGIFNLASGTPRKIGDILETLLSMTRVSIVVERDESLMRPSDIPVSVGDARRAREVLGWSPAIPWETTLRDTLQAHRQRS